MNRLELRFWSKVDIRGDAACWIWQGAFFAPKRPGRPRIPAFWYEGQNRNAARVSYMLSYGLNHLPSEGHKNLVCHTCDNPACVNPTHLYLGSHQDNADDMVSRGRSATGNRNARRLYPERYPRGTESPNSPLADEDVEMILTLATLGVDAAGIARCFRVSGATVQRLLRGQTYAHLDPKRRCEIVRGKLLRALSPSGKEELDELLNTVN